MFFSRVYYQYSKCFIVIVFVQNDFCFLWESGVIGYLLGGRVGGLGKGWSRVY